MAQNWISVLDDLPTDMKQVEVLCKIICPKSLLKSSYISWPFLAFLNRGKGWKVSYAPPPYEVTHWRYPEKEYPYGS